MAAGYLRAYLGVGDTPRFLEENFTLRVSGAEQQL